MRNTGNTKLDNKSQERNYYGNKPDVILLVEVSFQGSYRTYLLGMGWFLLLLLETCTTWSGNFQKSFSSKHFSQSHVRRFTVRARLSADASISSQIWGKKRSQLYSCADENYFVCPGSRRRNGFFRSNSENRLMVGETRATLFSFFASFSELQKIADSQILHCVRLVCEQSWDSVYKRLWLHDSEGRRFSNRATCLSLTSWRHGHNRGFTTASTTQQV